MDERLFAKAPAQVAHKLVEPANIGLEAEERMAAHKPEGLEKRRT
jgi:hypothetical protein